MSWRYKWTLLHTTQKTQILKTRSICQFSPVSVSKPVSIDAHKKTQNWVSEKIHDFTLNHRMVYSTLLNCPSDLIALSFFVWCAKQRDYFHYRKSFDYMVDVVCRLNERYRSVEVIVKELEGVGCAVKAQTFLLLLRIYWRGGMYSVVIETFDQMCRFGFTPNTFARNVLIDVLFRIRRVDLGLRVLKETPLPNFLSFNIALCNLCKLNDLGNVVCVLRMMLANGFYPNVGTIEVVLNCICKLGMVKAADQVLGLMISLQIPLSVNAWTMLIDGFCRLEKLDVACDLLTKMANSGCSPNIVTYTTMFKGLMKLGMVARAFDILRVMESNGYAPDLVLYNVVLDSFCRLSWYNDAVNFFVDMPKFGLMPDSYTFSSLLSTICKSRHFSLFPKLIRRLDVDADLVLCNSLLNYYCKAGFPVLAVELYNEMIDRGFTPDNYSFVGLLGGLSGMGRLDEAINVYTGIVMKFPDIDAYVHTAILGGLIHNGKLHTAVKLFKLAILEKYPLDSIAYSVAICGLARGRRTAEAYALFGHMKEIGLSPNAHTYYTLLYAFCKERDNVMVKVLLQELIDAKVQMDFPTLSKLTKLFMDFRLHSSSLNKLMELRNLSSSHSELISTIVCNGTLQGVGACDVKAQDISCPLSKDILDNDALCDSSSSEDLSDMAVSVG